MDFSPWDRTESFRLHEAACLIAGVLPLSKRVPDREELPSQAIPVYKALATSYVLWVTHHDKPKDPNFPKEAMLKGLPKLDTGEITLAVPREKLTGEFVAREELHRWIQATGRTSAYPFRSRPDSTTGALNPQVGERGGFLVVKLGSDDVEKGGAFVKIGSVAGAIAKALGSTNQAQAERKNFARINFGVQQGLLNPLDSETLEPLSRKDYGAGIVPFGELVAWGKKPSGETPATQLFYFQLDEAALYPNVVSLFERIEEVERLIEYWKSRDDTTATDAVARREQLQPLLVELASLEKSKRVMRGDCAETEPPLQQTLPCPATVAYSTDAIGFSPKGNAPVQRSAAQDSAVLTEIRNAGHDPRALPVNEPGKPGVKAAVRRRLVGVNPLFPRGSRVFDKAWDRLRELDDIADKA